MCWCSSCVFFFQAEDGIRDLVRSRGLGDVYKRQTLRRRGGAAPRDELLVAGDAVDLGRLALAADGRQHLSLIHI